MLLTIKNFRGEVWDADTGLRVPKVRWLDTDSGTLEAYQTNACGQIERDAAGRPLVYRARGKFTVKPVTPPRGAKLLASADKCCRCPNTLTLPGSELCAACSGSIKIEASDPTAAHKCASCSRVACWSVADEVEASPELTKKKILVPTPSGAEYVTGVVLWDRGMLVKLRYYCDRCYKPPRLLDGRGEVVGDVACTARPQW